LVGKAFVLIHCLFSGFGDGAGFEMFPLDRGSVCLFAFFDFRLIDWFFQPDV
jgi:hypothetical protein